MKKHGTLAMRSVIGYCIVVLLFATGSCATRQEMALEGDAALEFHALINGQAFDKVYAMGSEGYQRTMSPQVNRSFFTRLTKKMGQCSASRRVNLVVNRGTNGTFITARRATQCGKGVLNETFTWQEADGTLKLVKYEPSSPLLLMDDNQEKPR